MWIGFWMRKRKTQQNQMKTHENKQTAWRKKQTVGCFCLKRELTTWETHNHRQQRQSKKYTNSKYAATRKTQTDKQTHTHTNSHATPFNIIEMTVCTVFFVRVSRIIECFVFDCWLSCSVVVHCLANVRCHINRMKTHLIHCISLFR